MTVKDYEYKDVNGNLIGVKRRTETEEGATTATTFSPPPPDPSHDSDMTLQCDGFTTYYVKQIDHANRVTYALYGHGYDANARCIECGSRKRKEKGSYDKCLGSNCGVRFTTDYIDAKIRERISQICVCALAETCCREDHSER